NPHPSPLLDPAADEVDDLDFVSVTHHRHVERVTLEHDQVVLHCDTARVDLEARQQLVHRQGAGDLVRVAVQGDLQFPKPILAYRHLIAMVQRACEGITYNAETAEPAEKMLNSQTLKPEQDAGG